MSGEFSGKERRTVRWSVFSLLLNSAIRSASADAPCPIFTILESATARLSIGSGPGRQTVTGQQELFWISPRLIAATRPARATEDLPLPEEPTMARKRLTCCPSVAGRSLFKSH